MRRFQQVNNFIGVSGDIDQNKLGLEKAKRIVNMQIMSTGDRLALTNLPGTVDAFPLFSPSPGQ